jgi:hypothetical protein
VTEQSLLTTKQKAAELGVSRSTVFNMVRRGDLIPVYRDESNPLGMMLFAPEPLERAS